MNKTYHIIIQKLHATKKRIAEMIKRLTASDMEKIQWKLSALMALAETDSSPQQAGTQTTSTQVFKVVNISWRSSPK